MLDAISKARKVYLQTNSSLFDKSVEDIPDVENVILEDYEFDRSYLRILDMLHEKKTKGNPVVELFEPVIAWIIGAEMVGKFPKEMETVSYA